MAFFLLYLLLASTFLGTNATVFTLQNRCTQTLWPGIVTIDGPSSSYGDVQLNQGQTATITTPTIWRGQVWARTGCSASTQAAGRLSCVTGDCGVMMEGCLRSDRTPPPVTAADFIVDGQMAEYAVNLLIGFNVPISIVPSGGSGDCRPLSCLTDLNARCPKTLQVRRNGQVVACKSACLAFDKPEYCCPDGPGACKPSNYSQVFKESCPAALTYLGDDPSTSVATCKGADYTISFC